MLLHRCRLLLGWAWEGVQLTALLELDAVLQALLGALQGKPPLNTCA
jgi:hypothetical protein